MSEPLITLGWREWLSLPALDIPVIAAKVDTGARTSCLHTFGVERFYEGGAPWLNFQLHPRQQDTDFCVSRQAAVHDEREVTDSGGHTERRYVILTDWRVGDICHPIEITLTSRDTMRFRMLLGRTAMKDRCLVNPALSWQLGETLPNDFDAAWHLL